MIHVIAAIETADGRRDDFLAVFRELVPKVLAEEGCVQYGPTIDVETGINSQPPVRENVVTVVEQWESLDALEAHLIAPHMNEFRGQIKPLVTGMTLHVLEDA